MTHILFVPSKVLVSARVIELVISAWLIVTVAFITCIRNTIIWFWFFFINYQLQIHLLNLLNQFLILLDASCSITTFTTSSYSILNKKNFVKIESRMYSLKSFSFITDSVYTDLFIFICYWGNYIFVNILCPLSNFLLLYPSRWFIVWSNDFDN